jgi:hypothetical protein
VTVAPEELDRRVTRLIGTVAHWTPPRWAASATSGPSRAEVVHELVQRVADLAARAEGGPSRPVPVLDNDLTLPYQLRVVTDDLLDAPGSAELLAAAADAVAAAQRALHRPGQPAGGDRDRGDHQG